MYMYISIVLVLNPFYNLYEQVYLVYVCENTYLIK